MASPSSSLYWWGLILCQLTEKKTLKRAHIPFCWAGNPLVTGADQELKAIWISPGKQVKNHHYKAKGFAGISAWVGKIPWRRKWQITPVFLPGKSHGWRSLEVYSPWECQRVGHNWAPSLSLSSQQIKSKESPTVFHQRFPPSHRLAPPSDTALSMCGHHCYSPCVSSHHSAFRYGSLETRSEIFLTHNFWFMLFLSKWQELWGSHL